MKTLVTRELSLTVNHNLRSWAAPCGGPAAGGAMARPFCSPASFPWTCMQHAQRIDFTSACRIFDRRSICARLWCSPRYPVLLRLVVYPVG
jgi:hypothetical protein